MRYHRSVHIIFTLMISIFLGCQTVTKDDVETAAFGPTSNPSVTTALAFPNLYTGSSGDSSHAFRKPSDEPDVLKIESQPDLDAFWTWHATYGGGSVLSNAPLMPVIDFTKELIIVSTDVSNNSGGHSIKIQSAEYAQRVIMLNMLRKAPRSGIGVTAYQQPYTVIKIDRPAEDFTISSNITTTITGADANELQIFVESGKLSAPVKIQVEEAGLAEILLVLYNDDVHERAKDMRESLGVKFNTREIMEEMARLYALKKDALLTKIESEVVLHNYKYFPVIYMIVDGADLLKLLAMDEVILISENGYFDAATGNMEQGGFPLESIGNDSF